VACAAIFTAPRQGLNINIGINKLKIRLNLLQLFKGATIVVCLGIIFSIVSWVKEPNFRLLKANISLENTAKAADILDLYKIQYRMDLSHHSLQVDSAKYVQAIVALKDAGIKMPELPKYSAKVASAMASTAIEQGYQPTYLQPWFMEMFRLVMASLVVIVLIVSIIRPLLLNSLDTDHKNHPDTVDKPQPLPLNQLIQIPVFKQALLFVMLTITVTTALGAIIWAKKPPMRPLINDLHQVNAVQVTDSLEQHRIKYLVKPDSNILYVAKDDSQRARLVLAKIGVMIEYPRYSPLDIETLKWLKSKPDDQEFSQFKLKLLRLTIAGLTVLCLIIFIARPLVKHLLNGTIKKPDDTTKI
jgi:flagellar biosynthesis/type III secretory pathway M-ring protein FliF/YscJ